MDIFGKVRLKKELFEKYVLENKVILFSVERRIFGDVDFLGRVKVYCNIF